MSILLLGLRNSISHPLALATLTLRQEVVEWTDVRVVTWKLNGRRYVRHTLFPILAEHVGPPAWLAKVSGRGLGLGLEKYDVGCKLVLDVPVDKLGDESEVDMHVEG